jgi:molybdopterin-guanine dinucleotide biosynthesis protein A
MSRRFGADKALVCWRGRPLIAHVADALAAECNAVIVCGRAWGGLPAVADVPGPDLGPMGGLAGALRHAVEQGFDELLSAPCDTPDLPPGLARLLAPGPAVADGQWLIGLWPAALAGRLATLLAAEGAVSARRWIAEAGAARRPIPFVANINRPDDLPGG